MDLKGLSNKYRFLGLTDFDTRPIFFDRPVKYANEFKYLISKLN